MDSSYNALPQPARALIAAALPGAPIDDVAPTFGGFSHRTVAATIGGRPCVVKAADDPLKRADLRREARALALLWGSGLPVPELLALAEDELWTVEVQRAAAGVSGLGILAGAPAELPALYGDLGRILAAIHRAPLDPPPEPDWLLAERAGRVRAALPALGLDAELREALAVSLEHPAWRPASARLVHGDAGAHNILWEGRVSALLDWEWAGWGNPLLDLAWCCWTMRWRGVPDHLWPALLAAYGAPPAGMSSAALRALALGQIAGILVRAQGQPAAWEEWLRRARWTLPLAFPD